MFPWPLTAPAVVTARGCEKTDEPGFLDANTDNSEAAESDRRIGAETYGANGGQAGGAEANTGGAARAARRRNRS